MSPVFPTIGFNSLSDFEFINHPLTGRSNANEIACRDENVLYQISNTKNIIEENRRTCLEWYSSDTERFRTRDLPAPRILNRFPLSCPCSLFQAFFDRRYFLMSTGNVWCYSPRFPRFLGLQLAVDRDCCYSLQSQDFGALITEGINGGSLLVIDDLMESYDEDNFLPKSYCCSDGVGLCDLYYERRPTDNCARFRPLRRGKKVNLD